MFVAWPFWHWEVGGRQKWVVGGRGTLCHDETKCARGAMGMGLCFLPSQALARCFATLFTGGHLGNATPDEFRTKFMENAYFP